MERPCLQTCHLPRSLGPWSPSAAGPGRQSHVEAGPHLCPSVLSLDGQSLSRQGIRQQTGGLMLAPVPSCNTAPLPVLKITKLWPCSSKKVCVYFFHHPPGIPAINIHSISSQKLLPQVLTPWGKNICACSLKCKAGYVLSGADLHIIVLLIPMPKEDAEGIIVFCVPHV